MENAKNLFSSYFLCYKNHVEYGENQVNMDNTKFKEHKNDILYIIKNYFLKQFSKLKPNLPIISLFIKIKKKSGPRGWRENIVGLLKFVIHSPQFTRNLGRVW